MEVILPLKYEIIQSKKLVYVIGTGAVTFYELMHHIEVLGQDPKYKAPMKNLSITGSLNI